MTSIITYTADFTGADVYDASEANPTCFWPSAEHSAFYPTAYYQHYPDYSEMHANPEDCYWTPASAPATKSSSILPCLSLDDYSDFSSDDDSTPPTPIVS